MSSCATLLLRWNPWDWQVMTSGDWFLRLWFCVLQRISRSPLGSWFYMGFGCSAYVWELQLVREAVAYGSLLNDSEKQACMLSLNAPARKAMIQILHVHVCATCIYMNIWCIHKHGYSHGIYLMIILNLRFGATNLSHFICRPRCYVVLVAGCAPFGKLPVRLCLRAYTSINSNHGSLDGRGWWRHYGPRVFWLCGFAVCMDRVGISW